MDSKMNFPRLKIHSNLQIGKKTMKYQTSHIRVSTIESQRFQQTNQLSQKLNFIKIKYINKSPTYFKNKNRSIDTVRAQQAYDKTIENYVQEQSKVFDKEMLMELTRKRMKKIQGNENWKKKQGCQGPQKNSTALDQLHLMKQSKYQNFRPLRVPLKHTLKYIHHPNLTIDYS